MSGSGSGSFRVQELLAHQGGWDEGLLLAAPIVIFGALLWLAARRNRDHQPEGETDESPTPET